MPRIDLVHTSPETALALLAKSSFRARFHLSGKTAAHALDHDNDVMAVHARSLLFQRVGQERADNDGRQTPMQGHPVFVAQHACALCCRSCMQKWYGIPANRPLTEPELDAAVRLILAWIQRERESWRGRVQECTRQNGRREGVRQRDLFEPG